MIYPAITHPHKRHVLLVDMMRALAGDGDGDLALVLIGGLGVAEPDLQRAIAAAGVADRVVRPGRVTDDERDALIAGARALVFPSEYEGFGAPLIEAMLLGTPVVCSGHPALREVAGDAADRRDRRRRCRLGRGGARGRPSAGRARGAGASRIEQFTIARSGAALADAYRLVVERAAG